MGVKHPDESSSLPKSFGEWELGSGPSVTAASIAAASTSRSGGDQG